jgi:hypothetical protein
MQPEKWIKWESAVHSANWRAKKYGKRQRIRRRSLIKVPGDPRSYGYFWVVSDA